MQQDRVEYLIVDAATGMPVGRLKAGGADDLSRPFVRVADFGQRGATITVRAPVERGARADAVRLPEGGVALCADGDDLAALRAMPGFSVY